VAAGDFNINSFTVRICYCSYKKEGNVVVHLRAGKKTQFKIVTAKEDLQFLDVLFHAFWLHRVN